MILPLGVAVASFHQPPPERDTHGRGDGRYSQRRRKHLCQLPDDTNAIPNWPNAALDHQRVDVVTPLLEMHGPIRFTSSHPPPELRPLACDKEPANLRRRYCSGSNVVMLRPSCPNSTRRCEARRRQHRPTHGEQNVLFASTTWTMCTIPAECDVFVRRRRRACWQAEVDDTQSPVNDLRHLRIDRTGLIPHSAQPAALAIR